MLQSDSLTLNEQSFSRFCQTAKREYYIRYVRPSVRKSSAPIGWIFEKENLIFCGIFPKFVHKNIKDSFNFENFDKNIGHVTWRRIEFVTTSH